MLRWPRPVGFHARGGEHPQVAHTRSQRFEKPDPIRCYEIGQQRHPYLHHAAGAFVQGLASGADGMGARAKPGDAAQDGSGPAAKATDAERRRTRLHRTSRLTASAMSLANVW